MKKQITLSFHLLVLLVISAQLTAQDNINGTWGGLINADMIPVGAANLPDGKILAWSAYDRFNFGSDNGQTYTTIYDPSNSTFTTTLIANTGHDMFCPGTANLATGEIMITGGSSSNKTTIYNPVNGTFSTGPEMNTGRGYHSTVTLNDGRVLAIGGSWSGGRFNKNVEIWSPMGGWNNLANVTSNNTVRQGAPDIQGVFRDDNHAWVFAGPEEKVFQLGPGTNMHLIDTKGQGTVTDLGNRGNDTYAMNGNAVMYDKGKVLTSGGAQRYGTDPGQIGSLPASNRAYIIDINNNNAAVTQVGNMNKARTLHNSVVLPNGEVLVIGGLPTSRLFSDLDAHLATEIWNPNTGNWKQVVDMAVPRTYHSVAILMKDGRVWSAGGGLCGGCDENHPDAQIYTPSYLYNSAGGLATRPAINNAPTETNYNSNINVSTNQVINNFVLMRLSSVTHSVNVEQRRIPVTFQSNGNNDYTLSIPSRDWLPPGDYYLFALNSAGVPSVAKTIKIDGSVATNNQLIENGAYYIESTPTGQHMASPTFDENNVRMVNSTTADDQKWDIVHLGDNVYTLQNQANNRYLAAFDNGCGNGINVVSAVDANDDSKRWIVSKVNENYSFQPVSCSSHGIDNGNGNNKSVLLWDFSPGNNNQLFKVKPAGTTPTSNQLIANGAYFIESSPTGQHMAAPAFDENNVRMVNSTTTDDQKWDIVHLGDNVYTLQNQANNRYLAAFDNGCGNGINVASAVDANDDSKRWIVSKVNENYSFQPVSCSSHGIDNGNGNNKSVLLWDYSPGNNNQFFKVKPAGTTPTSNQLIANGAYFIESSPTGQHMAAPTLANNNVRMVNSNNNDDQKWEIVHLGDNVYTLQNQGSNRYLSALDVNCDNGINIVTSSFVNNDSKRWIASKVGDDFVFRTVKCSSHAIDNGNGTNKDVLLWSFLTINRNQHFKLKPVNGSGTTTNGFLQVNGSYNIKSRTSNQHVIAPGSINFNVQMANPGTATDVWLVEHLENGIHTIKNTSTNRFLEVESGQCFNNANSKTWVTANSNHQKWRFFKEGANFYFLPLHCISHALDTGGGLNNLTLMWAYDKNNNNQKFELQPVNGSIDVRSIAIDTRSLNATPIFGQKTALKWQHIINSSKAVSAYTFQHYDESMEEFIDLERVIVSSDEEIESFKCTHDRPAIGKNYYQVKIEFLDGSIDFSNYRVVSFEPKPAYITIAPNPAQDYIKLDLANYPDEKVYYFISSMLGEMIIHGLFDENHSDVETINLESIPNGNYIVTTRPEYHHEITQQFIIMKNY